ncbi:MAG: hypothetical protein IJR69_01675 [Bacteroidaceae bacterium]|nr:hypothetical protein [Bacteroidaceae bacterium]
MKKICLMVLMGVCLVFLSCDGKQTLANVAVEDSLCIDTVATLDGVVLTDTLAAEPDSLTVDSVF